MFVIHHITKAELFNSFNRNNNRPDEAEDVQHESDHSLDSDDNLCLAARRGILLHLRVAASKAFLAP